MFFNGRLGVGGRGRCSLMEDWGGRCSLMEDWGGVDAP